MLSLEQSGLGATRVPTRAAIVAAGAARDPKLRGAGERFRAALENRLPDGKPCPFVFVPYDVFESCERETGYRAEFHMTGAALDGTRVHLRVHNVPIDFYVEVPVDPETGAPLVHPSAFAEAIRGQLTANNVYRASVELVEGAPRTEYSEKVRPYARVLLQSTYSRSQAINALKDQFRLCREDSSRDGEAYWRKICRENDLTCTNPLVVTDYRWVNRDAAERGAAVVEAGGDPPAVALGEVEVVVDGLAGLRSMRPAFATEEASKYSDLLEEWEPQHHRRRGLGLYWDIETYKPLRDGAVPSMSDPSAETFMIGLSAAFEDEDAPVWRGVLTLYDYDDAEGGAAWFGAADGPGPQVQKILCPSEYAVACAYGRIIERLRPDYIAGFNDSGYDWPALLEIMGERHKTLNTLGHFEAAISSAPLRKGAVQNGADVRRYQAGGVFYKVTPDVSEKLHFLRVPGIIPIDLRMVYWKMFNKAEKKSLNFFLEMVKLPLKDDMACPEGLNPYEYMFRIVEAAKAVRAEDGYPGVVAPSPPAAAANEAARASRRTPAELALPPDRELAQQMGAVAKYCVVDAESCHRLLRRKKVLAEKREVGDMSFTCLYECIYRADGVRVLNLLAHFESALRRARGLPEMFGSCANRRVEVSLQAYADGLREMGITRADEVRETLVKKMKYPGAWVFDVLDKKIERERPITGLDFSSLYPSIIMTYCLSPDRSLVGDRGGKTAAEIAAMEEAARAKAEALKAMGYEIHEVSFPFPVNKALRNKMGEVRDWFVRARPGQDLNRRDDRGLYPEILIDLFARRAKLKKTRLTPLAHELEELDLISAWARAGETPEGLEKLASSAPPPVVEAMRAAAAKGAGNLYPAAIEARILALSAADEGGDSSEEEDEKDHKGPPKIVKRLEEILRAGHAAAAEAVACGPEASRSGNPVASRSGNPVASRSGGAGVAVDSLEIGAGDGGVSLEIGAALHSAWGAYLAEVTSETDRKHSDVDLKQKALKVFMNTFYGVAGNKTSPLFFMTVAGGTTTAGRAGIQAVARLVAERGNTVHYGDSVTGDTPVFIRQVHLVDGVPELRFGTCRIDELAAAWTETEYLGGVTKEVGRLLVDTEVLTDKGFSRIQNVICHKVQKPIVRIVTHTGLVDATTDHSLLLPDGKETSPDEVDVGTSLMHVDPIAFAREIGEMDAPSDMPDVREAFAMGLFAADGSCGRYDCDSGKKASWAINNQDRSLLERVSDMLPFQTRILETMRSSGVYKLVPSVDGVYGGVVAIVTRYRHLFYNRHREKRVPPAILSASLEVVRAFWDGFYAGDGSRKEQEKQTICRLSQKGKDCSRNPFANGIEIPAKEMTAGLAFLGRRLGYSVSINTRGDKPNVFRLTMTKDKQRKNPAAVKKKALLETGETMVYDLTTENHHFHVGPGDLVVHNTDSVYLSCNPGIFMLYAHAHAAWIDWQAARAGLDDGPKAPPSAYYAGRRTRAAAARKFFGAGELTDLQIAEADVATLKSWGFRLMDRERFWTKKVWATMRQLRVEQKAANEMLRAKNGTDFLRLAYEEVLFPAVFTGKKKYFGIAHEGVPNFHPRKLFIRGIDVIKQGQTGLAREIAYDIMWKAVSVDETREMRELVEQRVADAVTRPEQWKFEDFVRTDTYKPSKQNVPVQTFVRRMKARHARELAINASRVERGELPLPLKYEPPAPAEKFRYVVIPPKRTHTLGGLKIAVGKGHMMEFASVVEAGEGVKALNLMYYMEKTVIGTCARLIGGSDIFALACQDAEVAKRASMGLADVDDADLSLEDIKDITKAGDDAVFAEAKKYLMDIIREAVGEDTSVSGTRLSAAYRAAGKTVIASFQAAMGSALGSVGRALADAAVAEGMVTPEDVDEEQDRLLAALRSGAVEEARAIDEWWLPPEERAALAATRAAAPCAGLWCDPTVRIGALRHCESPGLPTKIAVAEVARMVRVRLRRYRDDILSEVAAELAGLGGGGGDPLGITCSVLENVVAARRQAELRRMNAKSAKDAVFDSFRPHIKAIEDAIKTASAAEKDNLRQQKKDLVAQRRAQSEPHSALLKELEAAAKAPIEPGPLAESLGAAGMTQATVEALGAIYWKLVGAELPIVRKERADLDVMKHFDLVVWAPAPL